MESVTWVQILDHVIYISQSLNSLGKNRLGAFALVKQPVYEKEK